MTAHSRLPGPFEFQPFAVGNALDAGVGPGRLRGPDLGRPFWGVRVPSRSPEAKTVRHALEWDAVRDELSRRAEVLARSYAPRLKPGQFYSHLTAARLHGIPLPGRLARETDLDVSVISPDRAVRARGIRGHHQDISPMDVVLVANVPASSPARAWIECAAFLTVEELICAGDYLLWHRQPKETRDSLAAAVGRFAGRVGRSRIEAALPELSDHADSPPESTLRYRFLRAGLPRPEVNVDLFDSFGVFLARPDLSFLRYRMVIDYEGDHHRTDRAQWRKDLARVPRLESAGWHSTRVSADDLRD